MDDIEYIHQALKENGVTISSQYEMVFESHIKVLIERLQNNECVNYDDMTFLDGITPDCIEIAHKVLDPLFSKYHVEMNEVEIGLFAIYIKLSKEEN